MSRRVALRISHTLRRVLRGIASNPSGRCTAIALLLFATPAPPAPAQVFGPARALNPPTTDTTDIWDDRYPRVTTDGAGNWIAVWETRGGELGSGYPSHLRHPVIARSADGGATWTAPAKFDAGMETFQDDRVPNIATDGSGTWVAVWDSRGALGYALGIDTDILVARSTDAGATWTDAVPLNTNAASDFGDDLGPQIATDGAGTWVVVWSSSDSLGDTIGLDPDLLVARSTDGGLTWTPPAALNSNAATDGRNSFERGPRIATDGNGSWIALWQPPSEHIAFARSTDGGETWTDAAPLNSDVVWTVQEWIADIASDGAGSLVAVWSSSDSLGDTIGSDSDILFARSTDAGATWTPPVLLDPGAARASEQELWPDIAADGVGNWVVVWNTNDLLGLTDSDILVTTAFGPADDAVAIDILPWSDSNFVDLFHRGAIPVAVLGSESFDVADVDAATLAFGPDGASPVYPEAGYLWDVDGDDAMDRVFRFRTQETGIAVGDTQACLTLATQGGTPLAGCDAIRTAPNCGLGFELALLLPPLLWLRERRRTRGGIG